jgi:hypothetical protein
MHSPALKPQPLIVWGEHSCPPNAGSKMFQAGNTCRRGLLLALCALLLALTPRTEAQRSAPAHGVAPHAPIPRFNLPNGSFALGRGVYSSRFRRSFPYASLPFPFLSDSFNPDDIYSTGYPVASAPPEFLLQAARALAGSAGYMRRSDGDSQPPAQPLVIELQNGRYVRVANAAAGRDPLTLNVAPDLMPENAQPDRSHAVPSKSAPMIAAASRPPDLPPAVLVFRDGHSEEVRDYTIADGVLYARGDYYTDGYWNKRIELSTLNVAQTLQANSTRSVKFMLPSSPNEVITRP